jgi:hypothetical protein
MELDSDTRGELDLGARMVNAARMAVGVHLFQSVQERLRRREDGPIGIHRPAGQDDLRHDSSQDDDNINNSLWQRPRTGGAGLRAAGLDDEGRPAFASARCGALVTDDDDEGGWDGTVSASAVLDDNLAPARTLPTAAVRSPRTPRLPAAGGAPPHVGGALPRPGVTVIGIGCGCAADRVRPRGGVGAIAWAEGAD